MSRIDQQISKLENELDHHLLDAHNADRTEDDCEECQDLVQELWAAFDAVDRQIDDDKMERAGV